ncbi:MAG: homoserine O-succinyltransferase [Alphaproteobacteria bacterium]|nr:homoserine O-succinyltransferase [Alphaproteobacteria bacterium]
MPIKIPDDLPASRLLKDEGIALILEKDATRQDIRPLQIVLLNLMPTKEATEVQLGRLLGGSPLQVELSLLTTGSYTPKNTPMGHLQKFYTTWDKIKNRKFDGLIITGAPVETMEFDQGDYWQELTAILHWSQTHVFSTFAICWGAQAALYHHRRVGKHILPQKAFGLYRHRVCERANPLVRGFDDSFFIPVSRCTASNHIDPTMAGDGLITLVAADDGTACLLDDRKYRTVYMFNHIEYDTQTLGLEYQRDKKQGLTTARPHGYYPDNDESRLPENNWRSHGHLLFSNWLNEVYQHTPFDIEKIGRV